MDHLKTKLSYLCVRRGLIAPSSSSLCKKLLATGRPINKMKSKCGTHEEAHCWINSEVCGLFCAIITWGFVFFGQFATSYSIIIPWLGFDLLGVINLIIFNMLAVLAVASHFRAMTTNPGAVPKYAIPLASDVEEFDYEAQDRVNCNKYKKFCRRCNAFKPRRAHHCSVCKRCIIKMDHHCPWLNNCVGIGNHKLFIQFIFWVNMMSCYSLILNASRYVSCINAGLACGSVLDHTMSLLVLLESILFALFTTCMMCDQWSVVSTNQTQIDRMKQMKPESKSVTFNEVFGVDHSVSFRFHFLCPTPVHFPANLKDEILGYSIPLNLIASSGSRYNDNSNDNNDKDGSYEMTPLTSAVDDEEGDDDVHTHTLSSQHRVGTDLSHIFNSPGGHGASSNVTHNNNNSSGGVGVRIYSGLYESKEEEEEELLLLNNNHHINGDTPKKSIFPSMFPSFSTLTSINANSQPLTLSVRPDPPSSPSKESPHRGSGLGLGLHNDSVDVGTPSSGQSSNQESLMESKSIFMRKRMPTTSTVV